MTTSGTRTISSYEKLEQIGEGTYGQVYRGRDRTTKEFVALKKIRVHNEAEGLPVTALREIKILKRLSRHSSMVCLKEIVTSKGSGEDKEDPPDVVPGPAPKKQPAFVSKISKGSLYLVLEYLDHDLSGLLEAQYRFSPVEIKTIMKQLLEALQYVHDNKFVHRDIKCSNLLISNHHQLKLADFGLAREQVDDRPLTNKVVTLWYRAPELLLGDTQYGPSVDTWSVGCILVELLIGRPIFPGKSEIEQLGLVFDLCGSPTPQNWPRFTELPRARSVGCLGAAGSPKLSKLVETFKGKMSHNALDLVQRLLTLDPNRRISAQTALSSAYFRVPPLPVDPFTLPPIRHDDSTFHEFQTKKRRRGQRGQENHKKSQD